LLSGILNINKPKGITSHDVVNQLRKILKIKRIGHAGTLDPAASGVLALCIGKTTRLIQYLPTDKQYIAEITLGITTDSYDSDGKILTQEQVNVSKDQLLEALKNFSGKITQQVPLRSATHYKGKKLYKYAQQGINITDLPSKTVVIHNIQLLELLEQEEDHPVIKLLIDCSSGTYIRSIANDLGKKLGCGAFLNNLVRTKSSGLNIEDSLSIKELQKAKDNNNIETIILSPMNLINWPKLQISFDSVDKLSKGQYFKHSKDLFNDDSKLFLVDKDNKIIAVGKYSLHEQLIKPEIVFI